MMGAITFVGLHQLSVAQNPAAIAGGVVVILTRVISIKFDLHLPKFKKRLLLRAECKHKRDFITMDF